MMLDKILLFPYSLALSVRHLFYDRGWCRSFIPDIPSICVGNLSAGGTGKTPTVEFLIRMFRNERKIAVVSRGYRRRSSGQHFVETTDSYLETGDEPLQIKKKFPEVLVLVDVSRKNALQTLQALPEKDRPDLVLLDDAFQHRKIKPACNILLTSESRPYSSDHLLPIGRLRDLPSQARRADLVIVTKVHGIIDSAARTRWRAELKLKKDQPLFFSRITYLEPQPVFPEICDPRYRYSKSAVLFSGIADSSVMKNDMSGEYEIHNCLRFGDHHNFTRSDIRSICSAMKKSPTSIVLTTEKDTQRITGMNGLPEELKKRLFYLPISMEILPEIGTESRYIEEEMPEIGKAQLKKCIEI